MLASTVGIEAVPKRDIGAVVGRDDRLGGIREELDAAVFRSAPILLIPGQMFPVWFLVDRFESIRGMFVRAAAHKPMGEFR